VIDVAYAFTLCFATLGPTKTIPVFYVATRTADWRTVLALAAKSTLVATAIVLFVALSASGTLLTWRVSIEAVEIAGGIVLALAAVKTLTSPSFTGPATTGSPASEPQRSTAWMGRPVLSPLAVPGIVPPVGIMVVLFFAATALGDARQQTELAVVLVAIMAMNFVAMLAARPIMRVVGVPVLQVTGWALSAVQAGLGVQAIISALRALQFSTGG
jgi:multiple antibiotic resistance protein